MNTSTLFLLLCLPLVLVWLGLTGWLVARAFVLRDQYLRRQQKPMQKAECRMQNGRRRTLNQRMKLYEPERN